MEIVSDLQRLHSEGVEAGVEQPFSCPLNYIPRRLQYNKSTFFLRGVVDFTPPHRDCDVGHCRAFAARSDQVWEIFDDLRDKSCIVDTNVKVNLHMLLYTV